MFKLHICMYAYFISEICPTFVSVDAIKNVPVYQCICMILSMLFVCM